MLFCLQLEELASSWPGNLCTAEEEVLEGIKEAMMCVAHAQRDLQLDFPVQSSLQAWWEETN